MKLTFPFTDSLSRTWIVNVYVNLNPALLETQLFHFCGRLL